MTDCLRFMPAGLRWTAGLILLFVLSAGPAWGAVELREQPWTEDAYGFSLRPPADSVHLHQADEGPIAGQVRYAADAARVDLGEENLAAVFVVPDRYVLRVRIRHADTGTDVAAVKQFSIARVGAAHPFLGRILAEEKDVVGGQLSSRRVDWALAEDKGEPDFLYAQAILEMSSRSYAILEFETVPGRLEEGRQLFSAILNSLEVPDPKTIARQRQQRLDEAANWLAGLDDAAIREAMRDAQWLRVLRGREDIGYVRVRQRWAETMGEPGVNVEMHWRLEMDDETVDRKAEMYRSEDGDSEMWTIQTEQQPRQSGPAPRLSGGEQGGTGQRMLWADTGIRSGESITISRNRPGDHDSRNWRQPEVYVSLADWQIIPALLPREAKEMSFYAYHPPTAALTLRHVRVEPREEGGFRVYDRPAPNRAEEVSEYDAEGRLVRREMGNGWVLEPSDRETIRAIWDQR
ncbi:MAG: hypothetical protein ACOCTI_05890 [Phycisphaeraceae bacterium]